MNQTTLYEKEIAFQADRRKAGVEFIKIISDLWFDKSIELVLFRNQLIDKNVSEIINLHEYAVAFVGKPINVFSTPNDSKAGICVVEVTITFLIGTSIEVNCCKLSGI